jgi:hypothetical protein
MTAATTADMTVRPPSVAAEDLACLADEAVDLVADRRGDLRDDGAPQPGAVLQQVVHDERPEYQAARQTDQRVDTGNHSVDESFGDRRPSLLSRRPGVVQRLPVDVELGARVRQRRVDRGADLVRLLEDAPHGRNHDDGHQRGQAENDDAGREGRLQPATLELPHQGLEDHGQNRREEQREHDLADSAKRDDHDDRGSHGPDEAPGPDPDPGNRAHVLHRYRLRLRWSCCGARCSFHGTRVANTRLLVVIQTR